MRIVELSMCGWMVLFGTSACGGCPSPRSPTQNQNEWEAELAAKPELVADARKAITIKRDVHNFEIQADADRVARAFHEVMRDPARCFGMIEVDRPKAELGAKFHGAEPLTHVLASRFQGRYRIEESSPFWSGLAKYAPAQDAFCAIENADTSDYGVIAELNLPPDAAPGTTPVPPAVGTTYVLEYHYLKGSPIAGSSRFEVTELENHNSRLSQIFTYQEQTPAFAAFFANGGLTLHDQVVASQVAQTVALLKTTVTHTDSPPEYQLAPKACPPR